MNTLSTNFKKHVNINSNKKLYLVKLSGLNLSTVACTVDGDQYLPVLDSLGGSQLRWTLLEDNILTNSSPTLVIKDYTFADGSTIMDYFYTNSVIGAVCDIYVSYEGLSLADSFLLSSYSVFDITYSIGVITLVLKSNLNNNDTIISGRKLNSKKQLIGTTAIHTDYVIPDEANGNTLPVTFGFHWCAPLVQYAYKKETDATYGNIVAGDRYYAAHDDSWWGTELYGQSPQFTSYYQHNIDRYETCVLIPNDGRFTPLHKYAFDADGKVTYVIGNDADNSLYGIKINGPSNSNHFGNDSTMFVGVPIRWMPLEVDENIIGDAYGTTLSLANIKKIFAGSYSAANTFVLNSSSTANSGRWVWCNATLDIKENLRGDQYGIIFDERLISSPSTSSFSGGRGIILGYTYSFYDTWNHEISDTSVNGTSSAVDNFIYDFGAPDMSYFYVASSPSASSIGGTTLEDQQYNKNTKIYGTSQSWPAYVANTDFTDTASLAMQGELNNGRIEVAMSEAPFIKRDVLEKGVISRWAWSAVNHDYADIQLEINNFVHLTAGNIPIDPSSKLGFYGSGARIVNEHVLKSVANGAYFTMNEQYQYCEAILRAKFNADFDTLGNTWTTIKNNWDSFYLTGYKRYESGFSLVSETTWGDFIADYIQGENFTVYQDLNGTWEIPSYAKTYTVSGIQLDIDYNNCKSFNLLFSLGEVYAQLDCFTDYSASLEAFNLRKRWRLDDSQYDYGKWVYGNTVVNNKLIRKETLEKKYTSFVHPSTVSHGGLYYGCIRTHTTAVTPGTDDTYWKKLVETPNDSTAYAGTPSWSGGTTYYGIDKENRAIAELDLNNHANKRRIVSFTSTDINYMVLQIGDIIGFQNVPYSLLGMKVRGFAGSTTFSVAFNGQDHYGAFIVTSIKKDLNLITVEATQLVDLGAYKVIEEIQEWD